MRNRAGVINVFATPYESWSKRSTTRAEPLDLQNNHGMSLIESLEVNDKLIAKISTHLQAAIYMLQQRVDNGLEYHIDRALDASTEYFELLNSMPQDEPEALSSYQGKFLESGWDPADKAIKAYGVEIAEGQCLFHGGYWASDSSSITTCRPFSTSFCPQVALRNAEWGGKAYDAGRVDLMVVCVKNTETKAYAYGREGNHGNEKEIVFASGANINILCQRPITNISVSKVGPNSQILSKTVPAYVLEVSIS